MAKIKFKSDKKGNIVARSTFEMSEMDHIDPRGNKAIVELLSPKGASLKILSLTINKKTHNVEVPAGKTVTTPLYLFQVGENKISFDGTSDTPDTAHEIQVTPKTL